MRETDRAEIERVEGGGTARLAEFIDSELTSRQSRTAKWIGRRFDDGLVVAVAYKRRATGQHIRSAVRAMRRVGIPIVSSSRGYRHAMDQADVDLIYDQLHGRAVDMLETESLLRRRLQMRAEPKQLQLVPEAFPGYHPNH